MRRLGVGIIGLGMAAKPHVHALQDLSTQVDFVAGYSPTPERRAQFERAYRLPTVDSLDALLNARTNLILVLTPPRTHAELALRCACAGKHVLLEKPVDVTLAQARTLVEDVERTGMKMAVVFQHRFRNGAQTLRKLLADEALGDLLSVSCAVRWWRPASYYAEPGRGMLARDGGGVLLTQAIHTLDVMLDLVGPVRRVAAFCRTSPLRGIDTEDIACATVRFANGALGVIDATTTVFPGYPEQIAIGGTQGSAVLEAERLLVQRHDRPPLQIDGSTAGGGGADPMDFSHAPHRRLIEDFIAAVRDGRPPRTDARSALPVHALIDAMLCSSRTGAAVQLD